MAFATAILIAVLILYCFTISRFRYFWIKTPPCPDPESEPGVKISVITAFRNESKTLPVLMDALKKQDYPPELYEVILVDDGSDDGSPNIAMRFCNTNPQFRYIVNSRKPGKKHAVQTGIHFACGALIVTTDADCIMSPGWLSAIAYFYGRHHPDLILGLVDLAPGGEWCHGYEQASFLSLAAAGSGAACAGHPIYCNGANMAFTKQMIDSLDDPMKENIPSGDDTFLLHAAKRAGKKIGLLKSAKAVVKTEGSSSFQALLRQRIRWASKAGHYRDGWTIYIAMLVLAINLAIPACGLLILFTGKPWLFLALFSVKAFVDFMLLNSYMKFLSHTLSPVRFVIYSLLYPFEVLISAFAGLMVPFKWKGRHYRN